MQSRVCNDAVATAMQSQVSRCSHAFAAVLKVAGCNRSMSHYIIPISLLSFRVPADACICDFNFWVTYTCERIVAIPLAIAVKR